jgi:hypothetical protein
MLDVPSVDLARGDVCQEWFLAKTPGERNVGQRRNPMMASAIVAPMCAYTLLLFGIWTLLGYVRVSGGLRGTIPAQYLRVGEGPLPPAKIVDVHHHFGNQFEVPVLFYLACITTLAGQSVDRDTVTLAWSFVGLRVVHTAIVLVKNDPRIRVAPYVLSSFAVWAMWANVFRRVVWSAAQLTPGQ